MWIKLVIVLVTMCTAFPLMADVYRYKDEHGKIHYSDKPFNFKQKNLQAEKIERLVYEVAGDNLKMDDFVGSWSLVDLKLDQGTRISDGDIWVFNSDSTFQNANIKSNGRIANYRLRDGKLQTNESGRWLSYEIKLLDQRQLVLRSNTHGSEYHLKRVMQDDLPIHLTSVLYRRDQLAKIHTVVQCVDKVQLTQTALQRLESAKQLISTIGFADFDHERYESSLRYYRDDLIFKENYLPKIARELQDCNADFTALSEFKYLQ